ncbi:uncharacterized protein RAG0_13894 [Rhynchosporium agropyri]|uniref:Uncharacterized protein n=2 Tax=Rhynchosporium TaxID=38037 RepID=A0A1E1MGD7_RHYSE|nr:uncharacterized protein RAG0_13894 [Rhynchosporium agropyri]CZT48134.1 uncharacterized protein RSE6_08795 [Rhynchosporium secalis]
MAARHLVANMDGLVRDQAKELIGTYVNTSDNDLILTLALDKGTP